MSKKYNRDAFETTNSGNDLQKVLINKTTHHNQMRQSIMTEIHLQHLIQVVICMDKVLINKIVQRQSNATKHYNRDEFEKIILVMIYMIMDQTKKW